MVRPLRQPRSRCLRPVGLFCWPLVLALVTSCGTAPEDAAVSNEARPGAAAQRPAELAMPYTAEQIRDAWVEGLTLQMVNQTKFGKQYQRWTVVRADDEGADIEYLDTDESGKPIGEPQIRPSLWIQLRDHARFPADRCTRTEVTRTTPLGEQKGWSYTLTDEPNGVVTEFFFAHETPGAPVSMVVRQHGAVVQELSQVKRDVIPPS